MAQWLAPGPDDLVLLKPRHRPGEDTFHRMHHHPEQLLAEPYIRGRELTTAVLGDAALLVTELRPKSGFYDFLFCF